ncbi:outer membrane protein transport protein [Vibrio aestuarianus]|uniref:Long-chain fatty acid outer membrane porin FadL2 n=1 Tax=Vibrio aestuarianus TaxID=28171 RepID=A0A0A1EA19_9VIBR|nr:outer membrane protein transport protein [Vibrio aestuarianus]AIY26266.1 long-chain fatty acid outer membrane porin FadL2 [Vibrio aestuarianus subsp. francensis]MDE1213263.1 outer membrane protein transport protein [Vibrio aestuarianus]MDE1217381.1 outer membrane protein transport protein [Vibrio aestuarianus]MDE1228629.1 outer membrane protein transport protein [Vibrio aestuarianus]MDE1257120.1 outer membrane protein transport protein [Vibrio aestuarianus]
MNKTRLFKKSLLAVTVALASQQALAAGFQLNAQSATGVGRAFAGDAVIADNASVMARNPAAMALFDKMELSLGFESITSMIDVKDAKYMGQSIPDVDDVGGTSIAPNIHLIVPVNDKFAWGVNAYSNFGTKTEFSDSYPASEYGGLTDVKSINFGLAGSYRINEQWSIGAGLDLIYGQGTMKRYASAKLAAGLSQKLPITIPAGTALLDVDKADGWAVGFNLGTVYELDENNRFGLAYHYSPEFEAKDDYGQKIVLPLPDIAEFSGFHKIKDTKFAVHYSVQWIGWSAFDQIDFKNLDASQSPIAAILAGGGTYGKEYQWQDGWHYAIGGTYYLNNDWTVRAGYMYDTSAQDSLTSVSVPDSDRQWLSAGFTYNIDTASNIDFGFTYLLGDDVSVKEDSAGTVLTATTHADAILVGLQYSRSF